MSKLTLYYKPTCPYSQKVLRYMESNNIVIPLKNINESSEILEELIVTGGKKQVPCLVIDGEALYESDDIIAWLRSNWTE